MAQTSWSARAGLGLALLTAFAVLGSSNAEQTGAQNSVHAVAVQADVSAAPLQARAPWNRIKHRKLLTLEELEELEEEETQTKWTYVVGIIALGLTFTIGFLLEANHVHWLPEAAVGVIIGFICAISAKALGNETMLSVEQFDFEFFMTWLLPPIIFEAGFNMNVLAFFENFGPTAFFAFVGTFLSTFVVGGIVFYAGQLGLCYPLGGLAALTFGSLISATDPVTVLAVFQALGVKVDLFSMVFGESVLNDAVAIVLSETLVSFIHIAVSTDAVLSAVLTFCKIFLGSMAIGIAAGLFSALVFKHLHLKQHEEIVFLEAALSFPFPWAAYFVAEALSLSGIVTILFCGIVMATYTRSNFSEKSATLTAGAYKCVALIAETYVFVYLGMALVTFPIFKSTVWLLVLYATLACFVGRLHIFLGTAITNCFRGPDSHPPPISGAYAFVMWFSGLRGGVAFALASVSYGRADFFQQCGGDPDAEGRGCEELTDSLAILQVTMLIAIFTIFVFGGSITKVCRVFDVIEKKKMLLKHNKGSQSPLVKSTHNYLLELLTWETQYHEESGQRYTAVMDGTTAQVQETAGEAAWRELRDMENATTAFGDGAADHILKNSKGVTKADMPTKAANANLSLDDKLDTLREVLPTLSSHALKRLLDGCDGNLELAVAKARAAAGSPKDLL